MLFRRSESIFRSAASVRHSARAASRQSAYLSDIFGTRELSAIHGRILTAWGVTGPTLVSLFRERTQGYTAILLFFAALFVLNFLVAAVLKTHAVPEAEKEPATGAQ